MPRNVLVTGGAGFIGSHVAEAYLRQGDTVTVLDSLVTGRRENVPDAATFVHGDIRDEAAARLVRDGNFDIVNNHAAQVNVRASVQDPVHDADVNLGGLLNLVQAAVAARVPRFIHVSSGGAIYGEATYLPTPEGAPKSPESPYGVSKLAGEMYLLCTHRTHGIEYVALRYSNVYGPRQDPHGEAGVVAIFASRLIAGIPLTVFGDGSQTRDYVHVSDVVSANLLASDVDLPSARTVDDRGFNVGTGIQTSVNDLAALMMDAAGVDTPVEHAAARPGEVLRSALDCSKLRALGWSAAFPLDRGLAQTYRHIASAGIPMSPAPGTAGR